VQTQVSRSGKKDGRKLHGDVPRKERSMDWNHKGLRDHPQEVRRADEWILFPNFPDPKKYLTHLLKCIFRRPTLTKVNRSPLRKEPRNLILRGS